ncbi:MAG: DUF350 domain-containing protein [Thermodesulfobacteriota bacterium]|nr:DUF350 domain-containing protein [Thermodesulfobacteriota bacterium]
MIELLTNIIDFRPILDLLQPRTAAYLLIILLILFIGKKIDEVLAPYDLNRELTEIDNKAVAVSFAGYLFGLGIIMWGVLSTDPSEAAYAGNSMYADVMDTILWGGIGIALLQIARIVNQKILLSRFDSIKELITDRNVGTGAVECGAFIGSAFIIKAALSGEDNGLAVGITSTLIFFACGQLAFVIYGCIYQKMAHFDLHDEIEKDNVSAGVAFGMSLVASSILLSGYIMRYDSLPGFAVWFVISIFFLVTCRYLLDKIMLPGSLLDEEISRDQNWGAALIEGGMAIVIALLVTAAFF